MLGIEVDSMSKNVNCLLLWYGPGSVFGSAVMQVFGGA
jgi:hypothetical protein